MCLQHLHLYTHTRSTAGTRDTLLPSFTRCFSHHTGCLSPPLLFSACRTSREGTRSPLVPLLGTAHSARRSGISCSSPRPFGQRCAERHLGGGRKGPTPLWCLQLLSVCRAGSCSPDARLDLLSCPSQTAPGSGERLKLPGRSSAVFVSVHVCSSWRSPVPSPRLCDKAGKPPLLPPGASGAELWPARLASLTTELPKALLSLPVTLRVRWLLQPTHSTGALQKALLIPCFKRKEPVTASTPSAPPRCRGRGHRRCSGSAQLPPEVPVCRWQTCHIPQAHVAAVTTRLD